MPQEASSIVRFLVDALTMPKDGNTMLLWKRYRALKLIAVCFDYSNLWYEIL
jgi:hypothetical protein